MTFEQINYEKNQGIATITLHRPEKLNALNNEMIGEWYLALQDARQDSQVKAVIVTGAGEKAFCTGADLRGGLGLSEAFGGSELPKSAQYLNWLRDGVHQVAREVALLDKPYLAAINGVAVGAGMDMASMCDLRFASESSRFSSGYLRIGIIPGDGGCYYLPRIVGVGKALELIWTGDFFDADEALRIGYINKIFTPDALLDKTREFATKICEGPSIAIQLSKRLVYRGLEANVYEALEQASIAMSIVLSTEDAREGLESFFEKRKPNFVGY
jgi:2-(1,2-epoxy-1,2-dihydrophenyl)acetyl-CoA isomerase